MMIMDDNEVEQYGETRPPMRCATCGAVDPSGIEFREAVGAFYHPSPDERALPCGPVKALPRRIKGEPPGWEGTRALHKRTIGHFGGTVPTTSSQ